MTEHHHHKAVIEGEGKIIHRRRFVLLAATSPLWSLAGRVLYGSRSDKTPREKSMKAREDHVRLFTIDYGRSFISGKAPWNRVRFWVESRTRIIDERSGERRDYYQCASCKSENTFAKSDLFIADNYDFLPVFGPDDGVIFRRKSRVTARYREWKVAADMWGGQEYKLRQPRSSRLLTTAAEIRQATDAAHPLVAQTEISDKNSGCERSLSFQSKR